MPFRRLALTAVAAFCLVLAGLVQPAASNPVVTVTTTGVISFGTDDGSLTGAAGSLVGQSVTMVQTFTVTGGYAEAGTNPLSGVFDSASLAVTIGAFATVIFAEPGSFGAITVGTLDVPNLLPAQFTTALGMLDGSGNTLFAQSTISSLVDAFIVSTGIFEDRDFIPAPSGAALSFGAALASAAFDPIWDFTVESVSAFTVVVTGLPTAVPTPAALGLLGLGLAGLALARRRRA